MLKSDLKIPFKDIKLCWKIVYSTFKKSNSVVFDSKCLLLVSLTNVFKTLVSMTFLKFANLWQVRLPDHLTL